MTYHQEISHSYLENIFWNSYVPSLSDFVKIPNTSRSYDPQWATNGLLQKAANHIKNWIQSLELKGLKTQILKLQGLTPLLLIQIEGQISQKSILYYGHFDKQPHMGGWDEDKGPTKPVIINNKLYGRGSIDDGYSAYSSILAVKAVQQQGIPHPKIFVIVQGDQQSGNHIQTYLAYLRQRLGKIDMVFCFDSGAYDYQRLWIVKSIRGCINFQIKINTLKQGVHSGDASGIVPSTYRIANIILNKLQNMQTGRVNKYFQVDIPSIRYQELYQLNQLYKSKFFDQEKFVQNLKYVSQNTLDLIINSTWKPQLTVTGLTGLPQVVCAGNVMLPQLTLKINLRTPPTFSDPNYRQFIQNLLTKNTPFNASIETKNFDAGNGWSCEAYHSWFQQILNQSSKNVFGEEYKSMSRGGTIPIISILSNEYRNAQIIVTGVQGPNTNAHGPNQHIDLPYTLKFTQVMAQILARTSLHYLNQRK